MDGVGQHGTAGFVEFWVTKRVLEVTGLSHSRLYVEIAAGRFPPPEKYPGRNLNFWPSPKVIAWQRTQMDANEFDALLAAP